MEMFRQPDVQTGLARAGFGSVAPVPEGPHGSVVIVELGQNSPNPFNESALVSYRVAKPGPVTLRVYDIRGRLVSRSTHQAADTNYQQITLDARGLPSGIYSYSLESNGQTAWKRCIIVK